MHRQTQDIRNAEANDQPDVNVTFNELMDELGKELQTYPLLEESDITIAKLAKITGRSNCGLRAIMLKKVRIGEYREVYKRTHMGFKITTYVKVDTQAHPYK